MALAAGSVTVGDDGNHTGSGLALAIYEADKASFEASPSGAAYFGLLTVSERVSVLRGSFARKAVAWAAAIVAHITANAVVTVTVGTGDSGLQRMPASTTEDTPCKAPAANKTLGGTIS